MSFQIITPVYFAMLKLRFILLLVVMQSKLFCMIINWHNPMKFT